jgi:ribosomal protein S18 acetylase RimI-like enzyme
MTVDIASAAQESASVRKLTAPELERAAKVLAEAFYDDPQFGWIIPDATRRMAILESGFELFLRRMWFSQDECYTTANLVGVVVWERPGEWKVGIGKQVTMGPAMVRTFGRFLPRLLRALAAVESNHPSEPHYYLPFIGVAADWQGRGIGGALMRPMLERCDRESMPAYLESSTPRNLGLYERHGFAVTEEFRLGKGGPPIWRMWRAPRSPAD